MTTPITPRPDFDGMSRAELLDVVNRYHSMLDELTALDPTSGEPQAGSAFEVDQADRNDDGTHAVIWGTRLPEYQTITPQYPYILGEV